MGVNAGTRRPAGFDPMPPGTGFPPGARVLAPASLDEAAAMLDAACAEGALVVPWGGGTHQGLGYPVAPDVVLSTARLDRVVAWEPDDLTLVVEAGAKVGEVEAMLAGRRQTAGLPEVAAGASVGGVVAAGFSGYRRARYGPIRDRVLEVTLVTGDGRIVRGGGRVVKNVSGFDLPRLATGSLGRLGLIGSVCLKLWPLPEAAATVRVADAARAWKTLSRPLAVLQTPSGSMAYLQGTRAEVESQAAVAGGEPEEGLSWPEGLAGEAVLSLRVPPALTRAAVERLPAGWDFVAQHGVGEIRAACRAFDPEEALSLRTWAEHRGGALVVMRAPAAVAAGFDPWGRPPPGLDLQRRLVAAFDPLGVVNRGRLPGGI